jgi:uncharacterized protein YecT (DUF1311 family)
MNRSPWILGIGASLFFVFVSPAAAQSQAPPVAKTKSCSQTATTQLELNECAGKELEQAEARLAALLKKLGIDANSPEEKAWEAYRNAQLKAIYPPVADERAEYGSIYPMCLVTLKRKLTEGHIRDLKMLTATEGDGCLGYRIGGNGK